MNQSQYTQPIVIDLNGTVERLTRISFTGDAGAPKYNEQYIQDLVFEHSELLPISEIDKAYEGPIPVCKEMNTPVGPLDVLYVTPKG